jgi:hypothetical protein
MRGFLSGNYAFKRGVSPIISTIIITSVAITVAVAAAFWISGTLEMHTGFEKIEFMTAYSMRNATHGWKITLRLKNTGTDTATISHVLINMKPINSTGYGASDFPTGTSGDLVVTSIGSDGLTMTSGMDATVYIWIYNDGNKGYEKLSSATTVNIMLHSTAGMDYPKLVTLQ